jgi:hypothetical protein
MLNAPTLPGGDSAETSAVQSYFEGAGLPRNQIYDVYAQPDTTVVYYPDGGAAGSVYWPMGVIERSYHGIRIVDSLAWAFVVEAQQSLFESVYWPTIPHSVLVDADGLAALVNTPQRFAAYLAALPVNGSTGTVVIRHTSETWQGSFAAAAAFEVGAIDFDINAQPIVLPDATGQTP